MGNQLSFKKCEKWVTLSIRKTEAPKSDKIMPQKGAGAKPANSSTLMPRKAIRMDVYKHNACHGGL